MGAFHFSKNKNKDSEPKGSHAREKSKGDSAPRGSIEASVSIERNDLDVIPVEKRTEGKLATCDGLYPHEVLVLSYADKYFDTDTEFQGFWWHQYGIKDVQAILQSLAAQGFIERGTIADAVHAGKLPAIKEELKKRNLKVSGKKEDLAERLVEAVPEDELSLIFSKRPYSVTESGAEILKKYEWIPYIHSHRIEDLDIWNLTEMVQTQPYLKYRDKIWGYLNNKSMDHARAGDYGLYRNTRFAMSEFVLEEGKTDIAFQLLCEVIAYDLSGVGNNFDPKYFYIEAAHFFPYEESNVTIAPGITSRISRYSKELGYDDPVVRKTVAEKIGKLSLPYQLFTPGECGDIVLAERDGDKEKLSKIYKEAEKRFNNTELGKKVQKLRQDKW